MSATASTDRADKVRELHDRLVAQVEALVTGEDWARYLSVAARFHSYSSGNLWLILAQRPDLATTGDRAAGYQTWKRLGRQVQAGAKGIAILAPCVYRRRGADDAIAPTAAPADSATDSATASDGPARVCCAASRWCTSSRRATPRGSPYPRYARCSWRGRGNCGTPWPPR